MSTRAASASPANDAAPSSDIVRRAQQGDVDAFELLYRAAAPAILRLCRRLCGDEAEARELVQDTFVRAWQRLPQFRGESALGTWLHRLAVNAMLENARRRKRDALRFLDAGDVPLPGPPVDAPLDARIDLDAALARLPAGARLAFVLHDVEGYSHDEIARMTGLAAGTVRAQAWRARRAIVRILAL